jgi:hypothetical protein
LVKARGREDQKRGGIRVYDGASVGSGGRARCFALSSFLPKDRGLFEPWTVSFRQQGSESNSPAAEWSLASSSLAFCDFAGQALLRIFLPVPSFIYSFIQVLSTVAEHKGSISYDCILHLYRAFTLCKVISPTFFFLPCL